MKQLKFTGYSDDTFACEGLGVDVDCDNCGSGNPIWMRVQSGDDALLVCGQYAAGPAAGWLIGVSPANWTRADERHIPKWGIGIGRGEREHSPRLVIMAPDDVTVTLVDEKGRPEPNTPVERDALVSSLRQKVDGLEAQLASARRICSEVQSSLAAQMQRLST